MPQRRTQYKISAKKTAIYDVIVAELQQNPELADYDMGTFEIKLNYLLRWRITRSCSHLF